jgi:hypothetical protein
MNRPSCRLPWAVGLVGLALIAAAPACSSLSPAEPTATQRPAPIQAATLPPLPTMSAAPTSAGGGGTATITMINQSGEDICVVLMSPSTDEYPDVNSLGSIVGNGESRTFEVEPNTWKMLARTCEGYEFEFMNMPVTAAGYQWIVPPVPQATLRLVNNLSVDICSVYIRSNSYQPWGDDRLGSDVIAAGTSYDFVVLLVHAYDLRAESCSGEEAAEHSLFIYDPLTTDTLSP